MPCRIASLSAGHVKVNAEALSSCPQYVAAGRQPVRCVLAGEHGFDGVTHLTQVAAQSPHPVCPMGLRIMQHETVMDAAWVEMGICI